MILRLIIECYSCLNSEKASIDESYLDLSSLVKAEILQRFPLLARVPADKTIDSELPSPAELNATIDWGSLGNLIPHKIRPPPLVEGEASGSRSISPEVEEEDEPVMTWSDVALSIGAEIVNRTRKAVEDRLVSISRSFRSIF